MKNNIHNITLMTNNEILKLIASRIKEERISQNLKQEDLANKAGLSISAIQKLEQTGKVAIEKLVIILRALNRLDEIDKFMDFSNELEELTFDEYKKKSKAKRRKRIFSNTQNSKEDW